MFREIDVVKYLLSKSVRFRLGFLNDPSHPVFLERHDEEKRSHRWKIIHQNYSLSKETKTFIPDAEFMGMDFLLFDSIEEGIAAWNDYVETHRRMETIGSIESEIINTESIGHSAMAMI